MFSSFFADKKWTAWAYLGLAALLASTYAQVQMIVLLNDWYKDFYDILQNVKEHTIDEFWAAVIKFAKIAFPYVLLATMTNYFTRVWTFKWREAMTFSYLEYWRNTPKDVEGSSQRIQEDTMRYAKIMETLGVSFLKAVLTLIAFLPLLWELSKNVTEMPWIGHVDHALVYLALLFSIAGTLVLAVVGVKLPGLEFHNQRVEAAYRKELVLGEDNPNRAQPETLAALFADVRRNSFRLYLHYLYFDLVRWTYLQFSVVVPYIALGPSLIGGLLTLGVMQQVVRAFGKVQDSFQYLVQSWTTIVELLSIYKRLHGFEQEIRKAAAERGKAA